MIEKDEGMRGHRQRMRGKIVRHGPSPLTDLELLEMILYASLPRIDTKPLSKQLLKRFGSLTKLLHADPEHILEMDQIGRTTHQHFQLINELFNRLSYEAIGKGNIISRWQELEHFCIQKLSHYPRETFLMIMLDTQFRMIDVVQMSTGTVNQTMVYPREILATALKHHAVNLIIVHNHPSGDQRPSKQDIEMTKQLRTTLAGAQISLHDHLIVAGGVVVSLRNLGLM